jgi:hypothetical protein
MVWYRHAGIPHAKTKEQDMGINAEYVTAMEAQLKQWDADVDAIAAQGERANIAARAAYHQQMKGLRASRDAAQKTFQEIRVATEAASVQMRAGMEVTLKTMREALDKMSSGLKH